MEKATSNKLRLLTSLGAQRDHLKEKLKAVEQEIEEVMNGKQVEEKEPEKTEAIDPESEDDNDDEGDGYQKPEAFGLGGPKVVPEKKKRGETKLIKGKTRQEICYELFGMGRTVDEIVADTGIKYGSVTAYQSMYKKMQNKQNNDSI